MVARRPNPSSSPDDHQVTVPKLNLDPVASLRPWPVVIVMHGREVEIPAMPATDWLAILMQADFSLDMLVFEVIPESDQWLHSGLDVEELYQLCLDLIEVASARRWWVAMRLIMIARESWHIIGPEMLMKNINPNELSLSAWLDVLLITLLRNMEAKDTTSFTMKLEMPPEGATKETADPFEQMEMSSSQFLAMN